MTLLSLVKAFNVLKEHDDKAKAIYEKRERGDAMTQDDIKFLKDLLAVQEIAAIYYGSAYAREIFPRG